MFAASCGGSGSITGRAGSGKLIGDESTAVLYLLVAGAMLWAGLFTDWHCGRR
jgi:hypothetical protein